jgi:hypothetical protein
LTLLPQLVEHGVPLDPSEIATQTFPATFDGRTTMARMLTEHGRRADIVLALLLADTRRRFLAEQAEKSGRRAYGRWVRGTFAKPRMNWYHHLRQVGDLLLDAPTVFRGTLSMLPLTRLLAIVACPKAQLLRFLEQYGSVLNTASREDIRRWIGEFRDQTKAKKSALPAAPSAPRGPLTAIQFLVGYADSVDARKVAAIGVDPWAACLAGFVALEMALHEWTRTNTRPTQGQAAHAEQLIAQFRGQMDALGNPPGAPPAGSRSAAASPRPDTEA